MSTTASPATATATATSAADLIKSVRAAYPERAIVELANGDAFVWTVEDVKLLRTRYNIIGLMSGTLPLAPQQNVFLGLPMQLVPEEVTYLLAVGAVVLVDRSALEREVVQGRLGMGVAGRNGDGDGDGGSSSSSPTTVLVEDPLRNSSGGGSSSSSGVLVSPSTSSPPSPSPSTPSSAHIHTTLASAQQNPTPNPTWPYPRTPLQAARCATFDDLHSRGYFVSTGLRFGGEMVAYPGDPLRYHSHFSTTVLASGSRSRLELRPEAARGRGQGQAATDGIAEDEEPGDEQEEGAEESTMSALDLVASGRLGTAVKKAHLICTVDVDDVLTDAEDAEQRAARPLPAAAATALPALNPGTRTGKGGEAENGGEEEEEDGRVTGRTRWGRVRYYSLTWSGFGT